MTAARGIAYVYSNGTPYILKSEQFKQIGTGYVPIIIFLVLAVIMHVLLSRTKFGRHIYAVGGNLQSAVYSGINARLIQLSAYAISGFCAGLAGLLIASRITSGNPTTGTGYETDAIAAAVIGGVSMSGGKGFLLGTIVGALIIGVIQNGLDILGISSYYQDIVQGVIILIAVLLDTRSNSKD